MFLILGLIILICSIYYFLTWNFDYWNKRGVVHPKPTVFLGNFPSQWLRNEHIAYELARFYNEFKKKTAFIGVIQFRTPKLLLLDSEVIKDVMIKNFSNFHDNEFCDMVDKDSDPIFGRNPFFLRGEEWKAKRAEVTPALTVNRLKVMFPIVEDITKKFVKFINGKLSENPGTIFDSRDISAKFTCDVVSNCAFGVDAESFTTENPKIKEMGQNILKPSIKQFLVFLFLAIAPNLMKILKIGFVPKDVEKFFVQLMDDATEYREKNKIDRHDYLEYLINLRKKKELTGLEMAAHGITFFIDGFETSSIVISHVLYELAKNKNVQSKLRAEIQDVFGPDGSINFEKISELAYLDQVFNESLRMHTPTVTVSRKCTKDFILKSEKGDSAFIENDMNIIIPVHSIHHDPDHYENPETFNPERFDDGKIKDFINRGVFMPFGAGPRICLGRKFATMQSKALIIEVMRNFEISVDPKTQEPLVIDPKEFLNIKKGGLWLNFEKI